MQYSPTVPCDRSISTSISSSLIVLALETDRHLTRRRILRELTELNSQCRSLSSSKSCAYIQIFWPTQVVGALGCLLLCCKILPAQVSVQITTGNVLASLPS